MNANLLIRKGWGGKLVNFLGELGEHHAMELVEKIADVTARSFEPGFAPMRNRTQNEINRRLDLCVDISLECRRDGWHIRRIIDELEQILLERLEVVEVQVRSNNRWVELSNNEEPLVIDTSREIEDELNESD